MPSVEKQEKMALVGGVCSGKTTLFNEYQSRHRGDSRFAFVEEAARRYFRDIPPVRNRPAGEQSLDNATNIQNLALSSETEAHSSGAEFIICDSSVLTAGMYMIGHGEIKKAEQLFKAVEFWLPTYNSFMLLNPDDIPYQDDELRAEGAEHRARTHQAYIDYFTEKGIPYTLVSGSVPERMQQMDRALKIDIV